MIYDAVRDDGTAVYYLPHNLVELRKQIGIEDSPDKNTRTITIPRRRKWSEKKKQYMWINPLTSPILCAMIHSI